MNPQGVRSAIDIFGENVRGVQPILSPVFGETMHIWVGAMMVGSINMTVKEGDEVKRGQEVSMIFLLNDSEEDIDGELNSWDTSALEDRQLLYSFNLE